MRHWLSDLDRILRGEATRPAALERESLDIPLGGVLLMVLLMAMWYGACMGFYAGFREGGPYSMQWIASTVKVPALFVLTLAVTFPSLYVFNALVGSRLNLRAVSQLMVASLAVNVAVLASMGPIVAFFSVSTTSYSFTLLLNVVVFSVSGFLGLAFLLQTLYRLSIVPRTPRPTVARPAVEPGNADLAPATVMAEAAEPDSPLDKLPGQAPDRRVRNVFICWMVIFSVVGAQMGWVLRPFVGSPSQPFQWFRPRESNFFEAVLLTIRSLFP